MRTILMITMRFFVGAYLLLTSFYCLLAFLPYTYFAFIKAPCYSWMPWFVQHHVVLYWLVLISAAGAYSLRRSRPRLAIFALLVAAGVALTMRPLMPTIANNRAAWWWAMAALVLLVILGAIDLCSQMLAGDGESERATASNSRLAYSTVALVAITGAVLSSLGVYVRNYLATHIWAFSSRESQLTAWSILTHLAVAIVGVSLLNVVRILANKTRCSNVAYVGLLLASVSVGLWLALCRFFNSALSFEGALARTYAALAAVALSIFGFSVLRVLAASERQRASTLNPRWRQALLIAAVAVLVVSMVVSPTLIGGGDWNGVVHHTVVLLLWSALFFCVYRLRPARAQYTIATVLGVGLLAAGGYTALNASAIWWAQSLGSTDDEIARSMDQYAARDASFDIAHGLLVRGRSENCPELCRVLRQYANIRNAPATSDIALVDQLTPIRGDRPNVFIFVIDSMRPDYLGAYNAKIDFTPNFDALARDSIVLRHTFTQYAGTTLSEPAIWAGMELLHTHYLQPFSRINSLEKLARADDYQLIVSYDTVLSQLLTDGSDLVKLDRDKKLWNEFEVCSTVRQLTHVLDNRSDAGRPVMFYAQPMNVHQFARNNMPKPAESGWRTRRGINNRIAFELNQVDACMGEFVAYMKAHQLYDNSIIVVTSDHGDATGELGRSSHSVSIYPEVMNVPLIVHLPPALRKEVVYDDRRISLLTDLAPSLYYLVGHRPILNHPLLGRPLFTQTRAELDGYQRGPVLLASDVRAVFGILDQNGRFLYATYDSPPQSFLFDLKADPNAQHNLLTPTLEQHYDQLILEKLQRVSDFYGYKPSLGAMLTASRR